MSHPIPYLGYQPVCYLCDHAIDVDNDDYIIKDCFSRKPGIVSEPFPVHELCAAELDQAEAEQIDTELDYVLEMGTYED